MYGVYYYKTARVYIVSSMGGTRLRVYIKMHSEWLTAYISGRSVA